MVALAQQGADVDADALTRRMLALELYSQNPASVAITGGTIARGLTASQTGNRIAILGNSIVAQIVPIVGSPDTAWQPATSYALNSFAGRSVFDLTNGYLPLRFTATTAGTSGAVEPVWPSAIGGTVTDGTVVWTSEADTQAPSYPTTWWHLAQGLSGQRLSEVFIAGRSGKQSSDVMNYVDRALASGADIIYFANVFENDTWPAAAPSLATVTANWAAAVAQMDRCRSLGKRVMTQTLLPSGNIDASSGFTGYVRGTGTKAWQWLNAQLRDYARARPDVVFFDAAQVYVDPSPSNPVWPENATTYLSAAGTGQQLKKTDGIHPYTAAAWLIGNALATVLSANFPAISHFGTAGDVNYVSVNPLNGGTTGTAGAGITSGTPATSMTMNAFGTVTSAALSQVARTDISGNWQQSTYVATAGDNLSYGPTSNFSIANAVVGDVVQSFHEVKILANPTLLVNLDLWFRYVGGVPLDSHSGLSTGTLAQDLGQFITADTVFTMKTVPMAIPVGVTQFQVFRKAYGRGAANFTVQYGRHSVVPVLSNPALA